jgi:hypothetical protein
VSSALRACIVVMCCVLIAGTARAQVPSQAPQPVTGFVPGYEITRIARSAGFDPLAPPLREGTSYVVRATDYRGILMRVVIDARTGAIRDVTRIVPGPGRYGQFYGSPSIYDPSGFDAPGIARGEPELEPALGRPALPRVTAHSALPETPPLPRPRPAALLARKDLDRVKPPVHSEANSDAPTAPAAPKKTPLAVEPLND